jgi:predicted tellurium resistance membrane protein TerC
MGWVTDPQVWASLLTLTLLEIVLGIDNLIFLSILADRLPPPQRGVARRIGLALALGLRLALLGGVTWIMRLTAPVLAVAGHALSWRDLILIGGGLFLVYKGTGEIHARIEGEGEGAHAPGPARAGLAATIAQIGLLDVVFSLDSVITAVGMASHLPVMVAAIVVAMAVMLAAADALAAFIHRHPTVKVLALSFLLLIGVALMADGFGFHLPRGYIYAAIGFSCFVEAVNLAARRKARGG